MLGIFRDRLITVVVVIKDIKNNLLSLKTIKVEARPKLYLWPQSNRERSSMEKVLR